MSDKINVKPDTIFLEELLKEIANGEYKIPKFQRDFVWKTSQMLELFDSILNGYPIGSLLFWKTKDYPTRDEIGPYTINKVSSDFRYVLDGFQRISTLFGVLTNPKNFNVEENSSELRDFSIFFDIRENNFSFIRSKNDKKVFSIPLYKIYDNRELFNFFRELDKENITETEKNEYIDNARNLHDVLHKYKLPYVEIKGGDIRSAVQIFSRVNSTGTPISEDSMLSALSYKVETGFKLSDSITKFLNSLDIYNFQNLRRNTILNCISNAKERIYFDIKIEDLLSPDLELFANNAYIHIKKAIEFLYKKLFMIDVRLLPYPTQLIFISEYFRLNPAPTSEQYKNLETWFWVTTYSNYFTSYSLGQQRSAYQVFCDFAKGKHPDGIYKVNNDVAFNTARYPDKLNFTGVRSKALQLFYLKSLIENSEIQNREGVKEIFISSSSKKDKAPANIILRLSSEFEEDKEKKNIDSFIKTSSTEFLTLHFITQEMVGLYKQGKVDEFITKRENYLKSKERAFVEGMGIKYTN